MKTFLLSIFLLPVLLHAQKIKLNEYDRFVKQRKIETFPVMLKDAPGVKMSAAYLSTGPSLYLQLTGTGIGANIIDQNDKLLLFLSNGATLSLPSKGYQSYELTGSDISYDHSYILGREDLDKLSQSTIINLKKTSADKVDEIVVAKENADSLKNLSALFKNEVKKGAVVIQHTTTVSAPAFPGGYSVWLSFLNRNLKPPIELGLNEKKTVVVEFLVKANGVADNIRVIESPGVTFDAEVMRVLKRMPRWKAAMENNQPTDAYVLQSITFSRSDSAVGATRTN